MSDTLIAFLKARLDDDEKIARDAAAVSRDKVLDLYEDLIKSRPLDDERRKNMIHISTFTPGRMLWEISAKRRISAMHQIDTLPFGRAYCDECQARDGVVDGEWPCETIRLLALPYAGHPDYDKGWST